MESAAERICETNGDFDTFDAQALEHLVDGGLVSVDNNTLWIQHQHIHRQPFGRHPQGMIIRHERERRFDHGPAGLLEHFDLMARSVRVTEDEAGPNDVESGIDVHRVWILEREGVDVDALRSQMTSHPLDTHEIGDLTSLRKDVPSGPDEVSGVETGFEFGGDKFSLSR